MTKGTSPKEEKMKIVKPDYYDDFQCIAGDCPFTCCQDWKITVDKKTKKKWHGLKCPKEMNSDKKMLSNYITTVEDVEAIKLKEDGKCPFLDEQKLCHIVKIYGESAVSHTCHTFPRETHEFEQRRELSLTMGCPVALDLLFEKDEFKIVEEGESKAKDVNPLYFLMREKFTSLMANKDYSIEEVLKMIFFMMLSWDEKEQNGEEITYEDIQEAFEEAFLEQLKQAVDEANQDEFDIFMEQNELFLDLAENYRKKRIYTDVLEPLAKRAEIYERETLAQEGLKRREEFEKVLLSYDKEIRLLMTEELFTTLILPETDMYTMLLKLQWQGMTYAVLKQCLFLYWDEHEGLSREEMKKIVMVLIRMTGYTEADIEEYMENSFEEIIWDWGYFALCVGKGKREIAEINASMYLFE